MRIEHERLITMTAGGATLSGNVTIPRGARGIVLFAHGSGSSRHSPRNRYVARALEDGGLATLLIDLLTADEERTDARTGHLRFDVEMLAERLLEISEWLPRNGATRDLRLGYFGASTGAGAALVAAARFPERVAAVVSRGGRPDMAGSWLARVRAPTLLIVGGNDTPVIAMNREARSRMTCPTELEIIPGATHLFEEPGALERVAELARAWFLLRLGAVTPRPTERESLPC
jgi:dienelactone hydrolase